MKRIKLSSPQPLNRTLTYRTVPLVLAVLAVRVPVAHPGRVHARAVGRARELVGPARLGGRAPPLVLAPGAVGEAVAEVGEGDAGPEGAGGGGAVEFGGGVAGWNG